MANCLTCGSLVMEPNIVYGYVGPVCQCTVIPKIQRLDSGRSQSEEIGAGKSQHVEHVSMEQAFEITIELFKQNQAELAAAKEEIAREREWKEIFRQEVEGEIKINERWNGYIEAERAKVAKLEAKLSVMRDALVRIKWSWVNDAGRECCDIAEQALKQAEEMK